MARHWGYILAGMLLTIVGAAAQAAPPTYQFSVVSLPASVTLTGGATDRQGNQFSFNMFEECVYETAPDGTQTLFAGRQKDYGDVDGPLSVALFNGPVFLAVDPSENVYVAEWPNYDIRKISNGIVSTFAGQNELQGTFDGTATTAQFVQPGPIVADGHGNVFVADSGGTVLRMIDPSGNVTTIAGQPGVPGSAAGIGGAVRFGSASPLGFDSQGNLYVYDSENQVTLEAVPTTAPMPPILTGVEMQAGSLQVGAGTSNVLVAQVEGTGPISYQWYKNGTALPGATQSTLPFPNISSADAGLYSVTVSNAVGSFSDAPGVTITVATPPVTGFTVRHQLTGGAMLWSLAYGAGRFVAVGTGGTMLTSTDGQNWTYGASGVPDWLTAICYGDGRFVAVGDNGRILLSPDGVTWTLAASSGQSPRLNNVIYAGGQYVAVGEAGTILTSPDGSTWTARSSGVSGWLRGLSSGPDVEAFVATGQSGTILTSSDGIGWSPQPPVGFTPDSALPNDLEAVINPGGLAMEAVGSGGVLAYAPGIFTIPNIRDPVAEWNWKAYSTGATGDLRGFAMLAGAVYATGENGVVLSPGDLASPWAVIPSGTTADLVGATAVGNTLYVVGDNETILASNPSSRLINVSALGPTGAGAAALAGGFSISGPTAKELLIRGSGPALAGFGVTHAVAQPVLTIFGAQGQVLGSNAGWSSQPGAAAVAQLASQVGAFSFPTGSADSALALSLAPGVYSASVTSANGAAGTTLFELYDADSSGAPSRVVNLSIRGTVTPNQPLTAGFVISGTASRQVLIRGVGPALVGYGIANALPLPSVQVSSAAGLSGGGTAGAWSAQPDPGEIAADAAMAGAFALPAGSADSAGVFTLSPGTWTAQVTSGNGASGVALVEIYDLP